MEQYKLIKKYPSLPEDWEEGMIIESGVVLKHFTPSSKKYTQKAIFFSEVIDYPEYWGKVVEKDYEILSFKTPNNNSLMVGKTIQGWYTGLFEVGSNDFRNEEWLLKHKYSIESIKRLSDGEIFTVDDEIENINEPAIYKGKINKFEIIDNTIMVYYSGNDLLHHVQKVKKQPLFTTEDGVDIFEGDEFFRVWNVNNQLKTDNYRLFASKNYAFNTVNKHVPHFSTKEKAEEYIFRHAPSLSLNDVNNTLDIVQGRFFGARTELLEKLTELIKSRK